ncbi:hypothetical protein M405DRAFT_892879 [Rhizopogon salebrosus TDB-379]|nr:hypothetical protein M405DRAFT_892879 [Rhizopogon salebrosus TDB-379]
MPTLRSALQALNVNVESFDPQDDDPFICPACHKRMKTLQGITAHLQMARICQWYKKGKLRELTLPGRFREEMMARPVDEQMVLPRQEPELDPMDVVEEYGQQMYDLTPPVLAMKKIVQAVNVERALLMMLGKRLERERKIRVLLKNIFQQGGKRFGEEEAQGVDVDMDDTGQPSSSYNTFAPFASELDWRVAHWAVSEGIGHKSFNRLMDIPGHLLHQEKGYLPL